LSKHMPKNSFPNKIKYHNSANFRLNGCLICEFAVNIKSLAMSSQFFYRIAFKIRNFSSSVLVKSWIKALPMIAPFGELCRLNVSLLLIPKPMTCGL
jgi:hypothetical protein